MDNSIFLSETFKKIDLLHYVEILEEEVLKLLKEHEHIWDEYLNFTPNKMIVKENNNVKEIYDSKEIRQAQTTFVSDWDNVLSTHYYFYKDEELVFEKCINGIDFPDRRDMGEYYSKHEGCYTFLFMNNGEAMDYICKKTEGELTICDSYTHMLSFFTRMISYGPIDYRIVFTNTQYEVKQTIKIKNSIVENNLLLAIRDEFKENVAEYFCSILLSEQGGKSYNERRFDDLRRRGFQTIDEIVKESK